MVLKDLLRIFRSNCMGKILLLRRQTDDLFFSIQLRIHEKKLKLTRKGGGVLQKIEVAVLGMLPLTDQCSHNPLNFIFMQNGNNTCSERLPGGLNDNSA